MPPTSLRNIHRQIAADVKDWDEDRFNALCTLITSGNTSFASIKKKLGIAKSASRKSAKVNDPDRQGKTPTRSQGKSPISVQGSPQDKSSQGSPQESTSISQPKPKMADKVTPLMAVATKPSASTSTASAPPGASSEGITISIPDSDIDMDTSENVDDDGFVTVTHNRKAASKRHHSPPTSPNSSNKQQKTSPPKDNTNLQNTAQPAPSTSTQPPTQPASSKQTPPNTQNKLPPLFIEFKEDDNGWKNIAHRMVKDMIKFSKVTQAKNVLIYPKDEKSREELLKVEHHMFSIRPTKGRAQRLEAANRPNLFAVARNVRMDVTMESIVDNSVATAAVRMHSAARNCPIASVKVTFASQEDKDLALKHGLKVGFLKYKVEDYRTSRPKQCINCNKFDHIVRDCPIKDKTVCKKCSGDHKHQECTAEAQKCSNCGADHPATYAGCPAYKQARVSQEAKQMTFAQKVAAPSTPIQSTRLAYALSQGIFHALKHILPDANISEDTITEAVCAGVTHAFKTSTNIQSVYSLK